MIKIRRQFEEALGRAFFTAQTKSPAELREKQKLSQESAFFGALSQNPQPHSPSPHSTNPLSECTFDAKTIAKANPLDLFVEDVEWAAGLALCRRTQWPQSELESLKLRVEHLPSDNPTRWEFLRTFFPSPAECSMQRSPQRNDMDLESLVRRTKNLMPYKDEP